MYILLNPRLQTYWITHAVDLFAITAAAKLEFIPSGTHKFLHQNRLGRIGGRTGLLFKKNIDVKKIDAGERTS